MRIDLPEDLEALVNRKLHEGHYDSPIEVIAEALQLLEEREQRLPERIDALRREVALGIEQLARGEGLSGDEVFDGLRQRSERVRMSK